MKRKSIFKVKNWSIKELRNGHKSKISKEKATSADAY